jgi:hypothetical protein
MTFIILLNFKYDNLIAIIVKTKKCISCYRKSKINGSEIKKTTTKY